LRKEGYSRESAHWTNVVLCAQTGDDWWEILQAKIARARSKAEKRNKQIAKKRAEAAKAGVAYSGPEEVPLPLYPEDACRPRLLRELQGYDRVIGFGKEAYTAVTGKVGKISKVRGTLNTPFHPADLAIQRRQQVKGLRPGETPVAVRTVRLLPTTLDIRRQKRVMERDVARAARWFQDRLSWKEPLRIEQPTPAQLRAWLWTPREFTTWDIETRAVRFDAKRKVKILSETGLVIREDPLPLFDALDDRVRLIGFGAPLLPGEERKWTMIVQIECLETPGKRLYSKSDEDEIWKIWFEWLEDPDVVKVGWNSSGYDYAVMDAESRRRRGRPLIIRGHKDGICYHHVNEPEYKHNLGFAASYYTDTPAWKENDDAVTAAANAPYRVYAARDNGNTADVFQILEQEAISYNYDVPRHYGYPSLLEVEHGMMNACRGMHRVGLYVDQGATYDKKGKPLGRAAWDKELLDRAAFWRGVGDTDPSIPPKDRRIGLTRALHQLHKDNPRVPLIENFNPGSPPQIREMLFDVLNLPMAKDVQLKDLRTKTGDRSTGDAVLRSYVGDERLRPAVRSFIHALRMYRRWMKLRSTFVQPMEVIRDEAGAIVWSEDRHVRADGRIHPGYLAFGTKVGRPASTAPNALNIPTELKSMYRAAPGHKIVGADQSALHLRIIGSIWGIPSLQEAFLGTPQYHRGVRLEAHELFARMLFGDEFLNAPYGEWPSENPKGKWLGGSLGMRSSSKSTRYAGAYGARPPTIFREVTSAEEKETGRLPFAHMTLEEIEDLYNAWMSAEPQWEQAWVRSIEKFQRKGFAESHLLGRRAWFLAGKETEIPNFDVLGLEGDGMNIITCEVIDAIPFEYAGPGTGVIHQNYDSIAVECPEEDAPRVENILREVGSRTFPGLDIPWVMEPKTGDHLGEV
jgi:hypothetical protein